MILETKRLILREWNENDGEIKDEYITGLLKDEWIAK